jgi:hypothetical protein
MSGKTKFIAVTAIAAALVATVAVARTVHTHAAADARTTVGAAPLTAPRPLANFACAPSVQADCDKLDWFPE